MCEIQDYSVEHKDIYNNKYSVSDLTIVQLTYNSFYFEKQEICIGKVQRVNMSRSF